MKLYQRYFVYGVVMTSFAWAILIYLYAQQVQDSSDKLLSSWPNINGEKRPVHLKPRYNKQKDNFDFVYGQDKLDNDGIVDMKRQQYKSTPSNLKVSQKELSELGIIKSPEDEKVRDEGYRLHAFNQLISDRIGMHRDLPDTRHRLCRERVYPKPLPKASIIICFHNEAWSALLRTVYSILDRTPSNLLEEIILVDDFSSLGYLQDHLREYVARNLPQVKLVRVSSRQGLIRARVIGAEHASGEVVVFLDSHCEVNTAWLQPLLERISADPTTVAIPVIDIINQDSFIYEASPLVRGGFNWGMHFRWDDLPDGWIKSKADLVKPILTPTMAGGLFAMDREYFSKMGKYDQGMDIWGGENLELSFRIWMCGGSLEILPCSRVGHIFRKRRPYTSPGGDSMTRNSLRVAHVWMDEYKEYYFKIRPEARTQIYGNVTSRVALRKNLHCHTFKWYLESVYPEQTLPDEKGGGYPKGGHKNRQSEKTVVYKKGRMQHLASQLCVVAEGGPLQKKSLLKLDRCDEKNRDQLWYETGESSIQLAGMLCLDIDDLNKDGSMAYPRLMKCHYSGGSQEWRFMGAHSFLLNPASGKCLGVPKNAGVGSYVSIQLCNEEMKDQLNFLLRGYL